MKMDILGHVALGGSLIGLMAYLFDKIGYKWTGFVYGAIPLIYIYLYIISGNSKNRRDFSISSLFSVFSWIVFVIVSILCSKLHIIENMAISLGVFSIVLYIQYKYAKQLL
jgi:hypothetical protein